MTNRLTNDRLLRHEAKMEQLAECTSCGYLFWKEDMRELDGDLYCQGCLPMCDLCTTRVLHGGLCKTCREAEDAEIAWRDNDRDMWLTCEEGAA